MTYSILMSKSPLADILILAKLTSYADLVAFIVVIFASSVYLTRGKVWDKPDSLNYLWFEIPQTKDGFKKRAGTEETTNIADKLRQSVCW
jgi:NADPH-ferrihemoprotein reductase